MIAKRFWPLLPLALVSLLSCGRAEPPRDQPAGEGATAPYAVRPDTPDVVRQMIEVHGGMQTWASAPTVVFHDEWTNPDGSKLASVVTVEQSARRAYLDFPDMGKTTIVWDGEQAWSTDWPAPIPPRFLALLNYYFVNLPWLTQDPGVRLEVVGTEKILDRPTEYVAVRMTFGEGVGDTPDDYYVLYIDPQSKRLEGCRYVVTYAALLPEGVEHTPEHILLFDEWTEAEGLLVPAHFTIYEPDGTVYASCAIGNWSFSTPFDESRMDMPADAVVDESKPTA